MVGNDPRRSEAAHHIEEAIKRLETARSRHLDHTDGMIVKDALEGLAVVQRSSSGAGYDPSRIAARLRQVAAKVHSCVQSDASIAYAEVMKAAGIFQAISEGK